MNKSQLGAEAPEFELLNQSGASISLTDYRGKKLLVLYFYPKDETPGCVKEACTFRDQYERFVELGAEVIGVSADSTASHQRFAERRGLPFQLLSDPDNRVRNLYGVESGLFGLLPGRETFVIDKEGIIRFHFRSQFQIDAHIEEALKVVKSLI